MWKSNIALWITTTISQYIARKNVNDRLNALYVTSALSTRETCRDMSIFIQEKSHLNAQNVTRDLPFTEGSKVMLSSMMLIDCALFTASIAIAVSQHGNIYLAIHNFIVRYQ